MNLCCCSLNCTVYKVEKHKKLFLNAIFQNAQIMKKLGPAQSFAIFCKALKMLFNSKSKVAEHWHFKKKAKTNY